MDPVFAIGERSDQIEHGRAHMAMDVPHQLEQGPGHRREWAAFWSTFAWLEQTLNLAFDRPPVMYQQRVIDENDRVGGLEARGSPRLIPSRQ